MQIFLARTQGFCAGVARAIQTVERTIESCGTPLYVFHEIVHNTSVVNKFKAKGVIFVNAINDVPAGSRIIFSAHGVSPAVLDEAQAKGPLCIDATCPLVAKVHNEAALFSSQDIPVILIGHKGHEEVEGTAGYVRPGLLHIVSSLKDIDELKIPAHQKAAVITQTTLAVDDTRSRILSLRARFPRLTCPDHQDICYATQNRQQSVKELAGILSSASHEKRMTIICGSPNSSNSNRLQEISNQLGVQSLIIDHAGELDTALLAGKTHVGISSGASVPRHLVDEIIARIRTAFPGTTVTAFENPEKDIIFPLPGI
ncbi:MAG: 4-hydroxy-3-methylbut-2-enyl diphosphate reductase [Candidatus Omnitrophota bacterium]